MLRLRALLVASLVVFAGCGGSSSSSAPANASPASAPKPLRTARSGVLFVVDFEALLPVGCFNDRIGKWNTGEPCLDLLPDDVSVELESGRIAKAGGFRVPTITDCTLTTPLLMFEDAAQEKPGSYAVWPPGGEGRVRRVDWSATKGGSAGFPEKDRARVGAALSKLSPVDSVQVVQAASTDLDADGTSEVLYSVNGGGFDPANGKGISALFLAAPHRDELLPLRSSDHAVFRVEAIVDVDGDGRSEVWLSERTFHPNGTRSDAMTLAWHAPGGLTPLTPMESCWPPGKAKATN